MYIEFGGKPVKGHLTWLVRELSHQEEAKTYALEVYKQRLTHSNLASCL